MFACRSRASTKSEVESRTIAVFSRVRRMQGAYGVWHRQVPVPGDASLSTSRPLGSGTSGARPHRTSNRVREPVDGAALLDELDGAGAEDLLALVCGRLGGEAHDRGPGRLDHGTRRGRTVEAGEPVVHDDDVGPESS